MDMLSGTPGEERIQWLAQLCQGLYTVCMISVGNVVNAYFTGSFIKTCAYI